MMTLDTSQFDAALKEYLVRTSKDLPDALNSRLFYVLLRAFVLTPPMDPGAARQKIRSELTMWVKATITPTGLKQYPFEVRLRAEDAAGRISKTGRFIRYANIRQFQARHKILQFLRAQRGMPGLYGKAMRKASGKFLARRIGGVGYLKSVIVRALRKVSPSFTQFGGSTKKANGRRIQPNAALLEIARQYGHAISNVGISKTVRADVTLAVPGWSPSASASMTIGLVDNQVTKAGGILEAAFQRAFNDEATEIQRHLAESMQATANEFNAR